MNNQPPKVRDGFQVRYTLLFLAGPLFLQVYDIIKPPERPDLSILLGVILGLYYLALTLFLVLAIAVNLYRPHSKIMLSLLLALALVGGLLWPGYRDGVRAAFTSDYVHFLVVRPAHLDQMRQPGNDEPLFHAWLWERDWAAGSIGSQTLLIYDKTDQLPLPPAMRSTDWIDRVLKFDAPRHFGLRFIAESVPNSRGYGAPSIKKLAKHFYVLKMEW